MPEVGTPAPAFSLSDHEGTIRSLSEFRGSWTVVYFYPKDDTPGCTTEACAFRDAYDELKKEGIVVLGISPDSVESHAMFATKHRLPFTLLADPAKNALQSYGAWGERSMYGKKYMGVFRSSVLIDPKGIVAKTYPKASPEDHAEEILADVRALRS